MAVNSHRLQFAFQIIKLVLLATIAIALIKFAFFPADKNSENTTANPGGNFIALTVFPERGDLKSELVLEGTIDADAGVTVKATSSGEVIKLFKNDGEATVVGEPILQLREEIPGQEQTITDEEGNETVIVGEPKYKYTNVISPANGELVLNALTGQTFNIGDVVANIQPATYTANANLTPQQIYQVTNLPKTAKIAIVDGPAPFECTSLKLVQPRIGGTGSENTDSAESSLKISCPIPPETRVFPGLKIKMTITVGEVKDALTIPISAVEGRFETGKVYRVDTEGAEPEAIEVKLGLSDGKRIQILEGLTEDQEILEFLPGIDPNAAEFDESTMYQE